MTAPSVDIIIPAHNEAQTLGAVLEALGAQDYPSLTVSVPLPL